MHPGWALFAVYFIATHAATGVALCRVPYIQSILAGWCVLQLVRILIPNTNREDSKKNLARRLLVAIHDCIVVINKSLLLGIFRVNFLWTLCLSILLSLAPFVWIAHVTSFPILFDIACCLTFFMTVLKIRGSSDLNLFKKRVPSKNQEAPPRKKRKIAVIGGGTSGIMTIKEMKERGHEVVGFERSASIGGVWSAKAAIGNDASRSISICGSRVTGNTLSSSSIANSMFGDFHTLRRGTDPSYPTHFTETDYRSYLQSYVKKFDLQSHVTTNALVSKVAKREDDSYDLTWQDSSGNKHTDHFDVVAVCSGLNQEVRAADSGKLKAKTGIKHTSNANNKSYKGKIVVIVGLGESSTDTAAEVAKVASHVHIIVRSPTLLLPRNTFGTNIAPDHKLTRALLQCPQYLRTMKLMSQTILFGPFDWLARKLGVTSFGINHDEQPGSFQDNWSWDWWILFLRLSMFNPNSSGNFGLTRGQVTKTAPLVEQCKQGKVTFHTADIKETLNVNEGTSCSVLLSDGSSIESVDDIINATGYTTTFPFLENVCHKMHNIQERYRLVYHPELPNMPFIGLARGSVGSIFFGTELQARWAALVASGERTLPTPLEMEALAAKHASQQAGKWPTKIAMVYANAIARNEIGCEPNLWDIFKESPKAWFYLMFGPFCVTMYRFRGPGSNPRMAREVFEGGPALVYPLEFPLQQGLELVFGFMARFWAFFLGRAKQEVTFLRQCVTPFLDLNN